MSEMQPLRMITVSKIGGNPHRAVADNKSTFIGKFGGRAEVIVEKANKDTGEILYSLGGSFIAINDKGEQFISSGMSLPGSLNDPFFAAIKAGNIAEFAIELTAVPANNAAKYTYVMLPVHDITKPDPLAEVKAKLGLGGPAQLEKPKEPEVPNGGKKK